MDSVTRNVVDVLLIDAHPIIRVGLRQVLERDHRLRVTGEAGGEREAFRQIAEARPHVVVVEPALGDGEGLAIIRAVKQLSPQTRVLAVSARRDVGAILAALDAGADGYLLKTCDPEEVRRGVLRMQQGERVLDRGAVEALVERATRPTAAAPPAEALSPRERDVLDWLARGATSKEIACALGVRPKTVENHRSRILDKLGVANSAAAVRFAVTNGLGGGGAVAVA